MRDASHYADLAGVDFPVEQLAAFAAQRCATVPLNVAARTGSDAVAVAANHGRWVVTCPDCGGGLLAHPADPRFMCADCGNAGNGGLYRRVIWPAEHAEIGRLLDARHDRALRNWSPGETVDDLREENRLLDGAPVLLAPSQPEWAHPRWFDPKNPHTHRYPKKRNADGSSTCRDCTLTVDLDSEGVAG